MNVFKILAQVFHLRLLVQYRDMDYGQAGVSLVMNDMGLIGTYELESQRAHHKK